MKKLKQIGIALCKSPLFIFTKIKKPIKKLFSRWVKRLLIISTGTTVCTW